MNPTSPIGLALALSWRARIPLSKKVSKRTVLCSAAMRRSPFQSNPIQSLNGMGREQWPCVLSYKVFPARCCRFIFVFTFFAALEWLLDWVVLLVPGLVVAFLVVWGGGVGV